MEVLYSYRYSIWPVFSKIGPFWGFKFPKCETFTRLQFCPQITDQILTRPFFDKSIQHLQSAPKFVLLPNLCHCQKKQKVVTWPIFVFVFEFEHNNFGPVYSVYRHLWSNWNIILICCSIKLRANSCGWKCRSKYFMSVQELWVKMVVYKMMVTDVGLRKVVIWVVLGLNGEKKIPATKATLFSWARACALTWPLPMYFICLLQDNCKRDYLISLASLKWELHN